MSDGNCVSRKRKKGIDHQPASTSSDSHIPVEHEADAINMTAEKVMSHSSSKDIQRVMLYWQLINKPTHHIYENLRQDDIEKLLQIVLKSTQEKFIFIPNYDKCTLREYVVIEETYLAFITWLLGRLLFLLDKKNLSHLHALSIETQVKIVRFLVSQRTTMFQPIADEFMLCLTDLIQTQKPETVHELPITLERFVPKIDTIEDLNLNQVFITIKDDSSCAQMQVYILQILETALDGLFEPAPHSANKVWGIACELLENAPFSVKTKALRFSASMLAKAGFCMSLDIRGKYLRLIQLIVERDPCYAETNPKKLGHRADFLRGLEEILEAIDRLHETSTRRHDLLLFSVLADILQGIKVKDSTERLLETAGVLARKLLVAVDSPAEQSIIMRLVDNLGTCKHGIYIIEHNIKSELKSCIPQSANSSNDNSSNMSSINRSGNLKILPNGESNKSKQTLAPVIPFSASPSWELLRGSLKSQLSLLATPSTPLTTISNMLEVIQSIILCAARVQISLTTECAECPFRVDLDVAELLSALMAILLTMDPLQSASQVRQTLEIVGNVLWMPGTDAEDVRSLHTAAGIMALPWLQQAMWTGLESVNNDQLLTIARRMSDNLKDVDLQRFCLSHVTFSVCRLPMRWPMSRLTACVTGANASLFAEALSALPRLMSHANLDVLDIVETMLCPAIDSPHAKIQVALSEVMVRIICLLAGNCHSKRLVVDSRICVEIVCRECDGTPDESVPQRQFTAEGCLLRVFLGLMSSAVPEVRRNVAAALPRISNHVQQFRATNSPLPHKWIPFLCDNDPLVRLSFAKVVRYLVFNPRWMAEQRSKAESLREEHFPLSQYDRRELSQSVPLLVTLNDTLRTTLQESLLAHDKTLQESLLATINEIGCAPVDCVLLPSLSMLMMMIGYPQSAMAAAAKVRFGFIATAHNCSPRDLYVRYKKEFCQLFVEMAVFNFIHAQYNFSATIHIMVRTVGFDSSGEFIKKDTSMFVPCLIAAIAKQPAAEPLLLDIAASLDISVSELIEENYPFIYPHIYLYEEDNVIADSCQLMESLSRISISQQKKQCLRIMSNELVLHLHTRPERVVSGLVELIKEDENFKPTKKPTSVMIADYLYPQFLGILVSFDNKLVMKMVCESVKRLALLSLPQLIRLMGVKYMTTLRLKVLATLRSALRLDYGDFPELNAKAWMAFVDCIEVQALGPLLSTIFASLLPLLDQFPEEVSSVFEFLVVTHEAELESHFNELYFVPFHTSIEPIYRRIQASIQRRSASSFKQSLQDMLQSVSHENIDVRLFGLRRLKTVLKNQEMLQKAMCPYDTAEPEVIELMNSLITGCNDADANVRLECGECLGEIGAIDPGTMPWRISPPSSNKFPLDVKDCVFGTQALTQLCKAYQSSRETRNMDSFSLAIQELLKAYNLSCDSTSKNYAIWEKFPPQMQEIMTPLLISCYNSVTTLKKNWPAVIYGSMFSSSLREWACSWAAKLIVSIEDEFAQTIFSSCIFGFKRDLDTLQFFLPYILLHTLMEGSAVIQQGIIDEVNAIIHDDRKTHEPKDLAKLPVWTTNFTSVPSQSESDAKKHVTISNILYSLIDFLYRWMREHRSINYRKTGSNYNPSDNPAYANIHGFLDRVSLRQMAQGSYDTHNYQRALIYLEEYVTSGSTDVLQAELPFFAKIYSQLDNADMVAAVMALRSQEPSLEEMILTHKVTGQLQNVAACYERLAAEEGLNADFLNGFVQCYLDLDQPFTALKIAQGTATESSQLCMREAEAEAFWRLQMFDQLEERLAHPELATSQAWGVNVGRGMLAMQRNDADALKLHLSDTRKTLIRSLGVASLEEAAYQQGYPHIVRLHMLNEFEKASVLSDAMVSASSLSQPQRLTSTLLSEWSQRLEFLQPSCSVLEPVLCLRRTLLSLLAARAAVDAPALAQQMHAAVGQCWVKSAQAARKAGYYQQAYNYILKAEKYCPQKVCVEKAKLYWQQKEQDLAFFTLRRGLEKYDKAGSHCDSRAEYFHAKETRLLNAEAKLLIAKFNDRTQNVSMDESLKSYNEAVEVCPGWEKSLVCLAQHYDRLLHTMEEKEQDLSGGRLQVCMIHLFGKSLQCGSVYLYQSMPRMLSIWLDYGTRLKLSSDEPRKSSNTSRCSYMTACLATMTRFIEKHVANIPTYMFLTAFSQILSRISHPQPSVYNTLKDIIVRTTSDYPQQALWMTMCVFKSTDSDREKKCREILNDPRLNKLGRLIPDFSRLSKLLIELTNKKIPERVTMSSVNSILSQLPLMLKHKDFSQIMLPMEQFRNIVLPPRDHTGHQLQSHNPLTRQMVYITGIEDEITVLNSLQKPRKVTLRASDGKGYPIMCKPKDDLRRDFRLMEFNGIVNKYLLLDPHSRKRSLHIRTYSVVPLNEECGILEWVPNLVGFRIIMLKLYKDRAIYTSGVQYKKYQCDPKESNIKKKRIFLEELLPRHPAVFSEWFRETFMDPGSWYLARTSYVRTTAVMSMVGYIMGLGDRHGENILFDLTNGETVHVDFNCLFNKGETFDWPERVPFRLTHNMVTAMGPFGVDGAFRRSCEITLAVMRSQIDTLMSVLRPFVYEPCVSYKPVKVRAKEDSERMNSQAIKSLANIESRLKGLILKGKVNLQPLSVEGQVNSLISAATDINNLADMYIGWAPYM